MAVLGITMADTASQAAPRTPARLAIYYGIPSLVNGAGGDIGGAAEVLGAYHIVVLGDGLQYEAAPAGGRSAGPIEHRRTREVMRHLAQNYPAVQVFGYLPLGDTQALSIATLAEGVRRWHALGVHGIFLDEAGYDFGVTRARQNEAIDAIHGAGLRAFVNAFNPDDVLADEATPINPRGGGNPLGTPSRLQRRDLLLLESFVVRNGEVEPAASWFERSRKAWAHRERTGVEVMTVTTTLREQPFDSALCRMAWWATVLWGFDGFGWGEPDFAAPSSVLPARGCEDAASLADVGDYVSAVIRDGSRFVRESERGVVEVDFARRTAGRRARAAVMPPGDPARSRRVSPPEDTTWRTSRDVPAGRGPA